MSALQIPAALKPADGRFGAGPSKIQTGHLDALAATGATARRHPTAGDEPLTSQETRVAILTAQGLSNKEIGAALFLSPKTIERHLGNVFRKRGLRSRTELAVAYSRAPEQDV